MGASLPGKHSARRLHMADPGARPLRDPRLRSGHQRSVRPKSLAAWLISGAALVASSALVAVGLVGGVNPAHQTDQLAASTQPAGTEFGASVSGLTGLTSETQAFGHLPIIRTSYVGVPSPSVWTHGPAGANKSAVVITFTAPPAAILSGADNAALARFFAAAPTSYPVYYSYDAAPEASIANHRFTAAQYRKAWKHVAGIASSANNPELKSTVILKATDPVAKGRRNWRTYLPGGNVISTLAFDAYPAGTLSGQDPQLTPPAAFMGPAIAAAKSAGLPFGVSGFALATKAGRPAWLKEVADYLTSKGALFGLVRTVPGVPATQLTDRGSIAAWKTVVAASGTGQPVPAGPPSGGPTPGSPTPTPVPSSSAPASPTPTPAPSSSAPASPTPTPSPSSSSSAPPTTSGSVCTTSAAQGSCGPYADSQITGTTSNTSIGNDVWSPISGWKQTLNVTNPSDWSVTANMPAGNTAVVSYPSLGANFGETDSDSPTPLSDFKSIYSSFNENMNANSGTSAWAAYDIWLGPSSGTSATNEVMIQHDFANNGACTAEASATFGGSGGVPVQKWNLCQFGSELVWKLTGGNEQSGTVDVLGMLNWLVSHGYLPSESGLYSVGYGWEICSTGGQNEKFQVNNFSITATQ
jgi:hypothetical protein